MSEGVLCWLTYVSCAEENSELENILGTAGEVSAGALKSRNSEFNTGLMCTASVLPTSWFLLVSVSPALGNMMLELKVLSER